MYDLELIGREKELKSLNDRLKDFFDSGRKKQALWLHVFGEEGIGKTRLIEELLFLARALRSLHCLRVRDFCLADFPFGAVSSALCSELGISFWESEYSKKEKLESRLASLSSLNLPAEIFQAETILPVFGQLLGIAYPVEFSTGVPRRGKGKLLVFNALRRYLQALRAGSAGGNESPEVTVLWFDDLERIDRLSLELLVHLIQKKESLWPLLVLTSSRSSYSSMLDYIEEFHEFSLGRLSKLSRKKILARLEAVSGSGTLPPQLQKILIDCTPGNPQLLIESYRLLSEKSSESGDRERKKVLIAALESKSRALDVIDLPRIMRERLHPLESRKRAMLQSVAILGAYSSLELASGLLSRAGYPPENLEELLETLTTDGFLQERSGADGSIRLSCALAYDILLDSIPAERLTALKQQCAELIHGISDEDGRDMVFFLGELLSGSYLLKMDWAVDLLASCGNRRYALEDYEGSVRLYNEAVSRLGLDCADQDSEIYAESLEKLNLMLVKTAKAQLGAGRLKEAFGTLTAALGLARHGTSSVARVEACLELGEIMLQRGDWNGAERFFQEAHNAALASGDETLSARCMVASGKLKVRDENYKQAIKAFSEGLKLSAPDKYPDRRLEILLNLGYIHQQTGKFKKAAELYNEALELARQRHDETAAVTALSNLGRIKYEQDMLEEALELFHQALKGLQNSGDLLQAGNWLGYLGSVYFAMEEYETAIDYYQQALSLAQRSGNLRNQGIWLANLGNAHYEIKEVGKALDFYLRALEFAREDQDYSYVSTLLSTIGVYYYNLKQYEMAQRYFEESLNLAREIENLPITVQNILYRGSIMACLGDEKGARRKLDEGEALAREHGMDEHLAVAELFRAQADILNERLKDARAHCEKAAEIAKPTRNKKLIAEIEKALAASKEKKIKE
jgi:tetratricopeptide (TPR) repeat protein